GMPQQMHELSEPSLAVVDGLARVVFLLGVIGVEEAADARMARAIDVKQLAVASETAPPPDVDLGPGIELACRQLDCCREHVGLRIGIHASPGRLATEMRLGEVPFAPDIEQILDAIEVEKERVAAAAGEKRIGARLDDIRLGAERDLGVGDDFRSQRLGRARFRLLSHEYVEGVPAVLRLRKYIAE